MPCKPSSLISAWRKAKKKLRICWQQTPYSDKTRVNETSENFLVFLVPSFQRRRNKIKPIFPECPLAAAPLTFFFSFRPEFKDKKGRGRRRRKERRQDQRKWPLSLPLLSRIYRVFGPRYNRVSFLLDILCPVQMTLLNRKTVKLLVLLFRMSDNKKKKEDRFSFLHSPSSWSPVSVCVRLR